MPELKSIPLADIHVPPRLREVEEDHALAIQASIVEHGLLNPVTVRKTPAKGKGKTPYSLVAGAHRFRAIELLDDEEIDAVVVEADAEEAQLIEITENLFRNDLSVLDRAIFVQTYRDVWEQKYGKISRGGDRKSGSKGQVDPLIANRANLAQLMEQEAQSGFSEHVADRLGFSVRTVKRLNQISQKLHPEFRKQVRGTPVADNQSQLLKLAQMASATQKKAAAAFKQTGDIKLAFDAVSLRPAEKQTPEQEIFSRLVSTWGRANAQVKAEFLKHIGATVDGEG